MTKFSTYGVLVTSSTLPYRWCFLVPLKLSNPVYLTSLLSLYQVFAKSSVGLLIEKLPLINPPTFMTSVPLLLPRLCTSIFVIVKISKTTQTRVIGWDGPRMNLSLCSSVLIGVRQENAAGICG